MQNRFGVPLFTLSAAVTSPRCLTIEARTQSFTYTAHLRWFYTIARQLLVLVYRANYALALLSI